MPLNTNNVDDPIEFTEDPGSIWNQGSGGLIDEIPSEDDDAEMLDSNPVPVGIDSEDHMNSINSLFGDDIGFISSMRALNGARAADIRSALGISGTGLEVLVAHPEFIPHLSVSGNTIKYVTQDDFGEPIKPYFAANTHLATNSNKSDKAKSKKTEDLVDAAYSGVIAILNNSMGRQLPKSFYGDIQLSSEDLDNLPELSPEEAEGLSADEAYRRRIQKARTAKRGERMGNPASLSFNKGVNTNRDSALLISANKYATKVDHLRAGIINAAMNAGKLPQGEVPENSSYAVSEFRRKADAILELVNGKYSDTPEYIANAIGMNVVDVQRILDEEGTAFGIPKPENGGDSESYEYAKYLIPWLYYLVKEYGGSTVVDRGYNRVMNTHTSRGRTKINDVDDSGLSDSGLYNFGDAAKQLYSIGQNADVDTLVTDCMNYLQSIFPDMTVSGGALYFTNPDNGAKVSVSKSELLSLIFFSLTGSSNNLGYNLVQRMAQADPNKATQYNNTLSSMMNVYRTLSTIIGTGGADKKTLGSEVGKKFSDAVKKQCALPWMDGKSGYVTKLTELRERIAAAAKKNRGGIKALAKIFGFRKESPLVSGASSLTLLAYAFSDPDIVRALQDISTYKSTDDSSTDSGDDESVESADTVVGGTPVYVDPLSTAKSYGDSAAALKFSEINMKSGDATKGKTFLEIPFEDKGAKINALVAPKRMIPLFSTEMSVPSGSDSTEEAIYSDLVPHLTHYIVSHSHGSVDLPYSDIYSKYSAGASNALPAPTPVVDANMLTDAVNKLFIGLATNSREAIDCREAWLKLIETIDLSLPAVADITRSAISKNAHGPDADDIDSNKILDTALRYIKRAIFSARVSNSITFKDTSVVTGGAISNASVFNGVNSTENGRILRKHSSGEGGITRDGYRATAASNAIVTEETPEYFEVSFKLDPPVRIATTDQANEYVKPTLMVFNSRDGESFYAAWVGVVTYSDFSSGQAENTLVTDARARKYHDTMLNKFTANEMGANSLSAVNSSANYELGMREAVASMGITDQAAFAALVPAFGDAVGNNLASFAKKVSPMVTDLSRELTSRKAAADPNVAAAREAIIPIFSLRDVFNGTLERVAGSLPDSAIVKSIIKRYAVLKEVPDYDVVSGIMQNPEIASAAAEVRGENISKFFKLVETYILSREYNKIDGANLAIQGDQSINERAARAKDNIVQPVMGDEDDMPEMVDARNGMHDGIETGGELSTAAEENGMYDMSNTATDYTDIFSDKYPMIGLIKRGPGMISHGDLADPESLCGVGLNTYDMKVFLGALDSAHEEVEEIKARYSERAPGIEMSLLLGKLQISYLIDTFYGLFSTSGLGRMAKLNGSIGRIELLNQAVDRFKSIATSDSIDSTLYSYVSECVSALDTIADIDDSLSSRLTGIANVIVYLESINPSNTVQGTNDATFNLKQLNAPQDADRYAKMIASNYTEKSKNQITDDLQNLRNELLNGNLKIYGANTKFGETVAQMFHVFDRTETQGFDSQLDPFGTMIERLRTKAVGADVHLHGAMANSDLMAALVSAIIDDERSNGDGGYTKVKEVLTALANGNPIEVPYLITHEPRHINGDKAMSVDADSTESISFNAEGKKTNSASATFATIGDVVRAANGNPESQNAKITLKNLTTPLVDENGTVDDNLVKDLVTGVRVAVTENLLSSAGDRNAIQARINNLFISGASDIKGNESGFVSLALIIMLLYTRSIDKARMSQVNTARDVMTERMHQGQVDQAEARIAEIDPSLAKAAKDNGVGSNAALTDTIDYLVEYGMRGTDPAVSDDERATARRTIEQSDEASRKFGTVAESFLDQFYRNLHRMRIDHIESDETRKSRIKILAEKYLSRALRNNGDVTNHINANPNVSAMRGLIKLLVDYRNAVGPNQAELPDYKTNPNKPGASEYNQIRGAMKTAELADLVINGYLKQTMHTENQDRLANVAQVYVGQLMATDPIFRSNILADRNNREDIIDVQGTTPLDDSAVYTNKRHGNVVADALELGDKKSEKDKRVLFDAGVSESGINKVNGTFTEFDRIIKSNLLDSIKQYESKAKLLAANPEGTGPRFDNARKIVNEHNPNGGTTFGGYMVKLRGLVEELVNKDVDSRYAGIPADSTEMESLRGYIEQLPTKLNTAWAQPDASARENDIDAIIQTGHSLLANVYAHGRSIYRKGALQAVANLSKNTTLVPQELKVDDCITLLTALSKIDHAISVNATAPGSDETMYMIYGRPRTKDEAAAIVNAAVSDITNTEYVDALIHGDVHELLYNYREPKNQSILKLLSTYVKAHSAMTTGAEVKPENVAEYVLAVLNRAKCVKRDVNGYSHTVSANNGDRYKCIIPMKYINDTVANKMPNDMDINTWAATKSKFEQFTLSSMMERYNGNGDSELDTLVALTRNVLNTIHNACVGVANKAVDQHADEYNGANGISATRTNVAADTTDVELSNN